MKNAYKILDVENGKRKPGRHKRRLLENIKMYVKQSDVKV
jgi:hypothetical protein